MDCNDVKIQKRTLSGALKYFGKKMLTYRIEYPVFYSSRYKECVRKLNKQYRDEALEYRRYCMTDLFSLAVDQYKESVENSYPFNVYEAVQAFEATYSRSCAVSLYIDRYEFTGGAHGNTIRQSQNWQLGSCEQIELAELIDCQPNYKAYIISMVSESIKSEEDIYFENYPKLISETFNPNNFYCTPEGIVFYYQQYDIAPYSSGIREFLIPYSPCVIDPANLCEK